MVVYKFPDDKKQEKAQAKDPDYIYVEEEWRSEKEGNLGIDPESLRPLGRQFEMKTGILWRIFMFVASFIALAVSALFLLLVLISAGLSFVTFFQVPAILENLKLSWKRWKKSMIFFLGFFLAIFDTPLGITLLLVYFSLKGERDGEKIVSQIFKQNSRSS